MSRAALVSIIGWLALGAASPALATESEGPPVVVRAFAEPEQVFIGDPFRYVVEVRARPGTEVAIPLLTGQVGVFTIVDFGEEPTREEDGHVVVARWYRMVGFETGEPFLPPPEVRFAVAGAAPETALGNSVSIRVLSLLEREPEARDIRDVKPPEEVPFDATPYLTVLAVLVALLALAYLLYRFWYWPRHAAEPQPRPAHEVALEALAQLRRQGLVEAGEIAAFYVGLTNIVRVYLENGLGLRAPEMTTEEFLSAAGVDERLTAKQRRVLGEFLTQADLVKFARAVPTASDCDAAYDAAQRFVAETRPQPAQREEGRRAAA